MDSIVGKVFARVVISRLQVLADGVHPESQCGFIRSGRSTINMIFSVRQLQEKCKEQQQPLYLASIDLTKAFDLVSCSGLFKLLQRIDCLPTLLSIITSFHTTMLSTQLASMAACPNLLRSEAESSKAVCLHQPSLVYFSPSFWPMPSKHPPMGFTCTPGMMANCSI